MSTNPRWTWGVQKEQSAGCLELSENLQDGEWRKPQGRRVLRADPGPSGCEEVGECAGHLCEKGVVSRAGGGYGFDQNQWVGLAEGTGS